MIKIAVRCCRCGSIIELEVREEDFNRWDNGENVQDCFPYLDAGQRELLISRVCDDCFNEMFAEEEEE